MAGQILIETGKTGVNGRYAVCELFATPKQRMGK
jgi:hypothetical protein